MDATVILTMFLVISIVIAIAIGANDETMAPLYGSRILNMRQILILNNFCNLWSYSVRRRCCKICWK